jgi:hypothetical protein
MIGIGTPITHSRMERMTHISVRPHPATKWFGTETVPWPKTPVRLFGMALAPISAVKYSPPR